MYHVMYVVPRYVPSLFMCHVCLSVCPCMYVCMYVKSCTLVKCLYMSCKLNVVGTIVYNSYIHVHYLRI